MIYRYFECQCGNKFNAFVESTDSTKPEAKCERCGAMAIVCWNDPKAVGTKLLFNYMER